MTDNLIKTITTALPGLKALGLPKNYYLGTRPLSFDIPCNVLIWLHERPDQSRFDAYHYRHILCFNLKTAGQTVVDHRIHDFRPGEGFLIFPFQFHHFFIPANEQRQWVYIGFETKTSEPLLGYQNRPFAMTQGMADVLARLLRAYAQEAGGRALQNQTPLLLALLLNEMILFSPAPLNPQARPEKSLIHETLAAKVQRHVHAHLNEPISIKDIARTLGLSESRLRARYRQELGISLGKTIQSMRLTRAQELLTVSEMNISEIASACGYDSLYAFSLAFKKRFKVSPLNFRKQLR